ncbi:hypothetical protein MKW94_000020 [Papaver nudicaule]|uniref:Uncharacterized protein n=1 Tax=Papaver nudicaule TaxID=74823 RepID=A0AA42B3Z0_PAPNU|nr:hypothetical protein [Papaver nudicaule]
MAMFLCCSSTTLVPLSSKSNSLFPLISSSCSITTNTQSTSFHSRVSFQSSRASRIRCQAQNSLDSTVYKGIYGLWSVDSNDIHEVILYRSGLVTAAATFVIGGSTAFLPDDFLLTNVLKQNLDVLYALGAGGLGLLLFLIHIYVTEIKRTLQALWALGVFGSVEASLRLAQPVGENLPQYVVDHSMAVWFIGPLFAALTGLVFKEVVLISLHYLFMGTGLCYGKLEAGILTFIIPSVLTLYTQLICSYFLDDLGLIIYQLFLGILVDISVLFHRNILKHFSIFLMFVLPLQKAQKTKFIF